MWEKASGGSQSVEKLILSNAKCVIINFASFFSHVLFSRFFLTWMHPFLKVLILTQEVYKSKKKTGVFDKGRQFHRLLCLFCQVTNIIFFINPKSADTRGNPGIRSGTHASVSIQFKAKVNRSQDENHSGFQSVSEKTGAPNDNFRKNICSEDGLRSRIFGTFVVKFLACLSLLGFSNI